MTIDDFNDLDHPFRWDFTSNVSKVDPQPGMQAIF